MKSKFYEQSFVGIILAALVLSISMFSLGYLFGNFSAKETEKEYSKPVSAIVDGEEMPVISVKMHGNYAEIVTDGDEKIVVSTRNLVIYEDEKYYNGEK